MNKLIVCLLTVLMSFSASAFAADSEHEQERVKDAGEVLKEILNIPDDIPQDLLDKAECVVVLPSVKKGAFGIGGSYGRGVMVCRNGQHYTGKWGAPALYALEGISIGFQLGGQATDFVLLVMNPKGATSLLTSKVKLGADASAAAGPKGPNRRGRDRYRDERRNPFVLSQQGIVCRRFSGRLDAALRWQRQREACMDAG
jgi:lipid-binding SYLF domain-containing protein